MSDNGIITNNAEVKNLPPPIDAKATVSVKNNGLEAILKLTPPENGGIALSYETLKSSLELNGVVFGVNDTELIMLSVNPVYYTDIVIARGYPAENGEDAELIYHVEMDKHLQPKEKEDGSVDFKDLGIIQEVKKDTLLCEKIPYTEGTPGVTVTGKSLAAAHGKDKVMPAGKNTVLSEDTLQLCAEIDGHLSIISGKINILDVFTVQGNVSNETGNINFTGSVIVRGDVVQGYEVNATGDVTINGVVEAAKITAGGSLIIRGGFHGGESGALDIGGDAACLFIGGGRVTVKGNLETTYIMQSTVKCGGDINLTGRGLIRGGYVMARKSVNANNLGSSSSTSAPTIVEVGNDPVIMERINEITKELEAGEKNIANLEMVINALSKLKEANRLTPDKAENLIKANEYIIKVREMNEELKDEYEIIKKQIEELGYGKINVLKTAYAGLKIVIGPDSMTLQSDYSNSSFFRSPKGIEFVPAK